MTEIEDLLSQSLPAVADDGFSALVLNHVRAEQIRGQLTTVVTVAVCAALAILFLPLREIGTTFGVLIPQMANSTAMIAAAGAIVLSLVLERQLFRS
jgi:hypothetical protein